MVSLHLQQLSTSLTEYAPAQATLNFQQLHYQNLAHQGTHARSLYVCFFFFFLAYEHGKIIFKPISYKAVTESQPKLYLF